MGCKMGKNHADIIRSGIALTQKKKERKKESFLGKPLKTEFILGNKKESKDFVSIFLCGCEICGGRRMFLWKQ